MNIQIQSINFVAKNHLIEFVKKKLSKLISLHYNMINADVYLKIDKLDSHDNKVVEIKIHSSEGDFFAKKQSNSFEESTDLASQALRKQIIKNKKR